MYKVIVVGAGHAGCEAALACSKKGHNTLLITSNLHNIATMPCNPSIGGSAKGVVVREIDALGGVMGRCADLCQIQMKMLNFSKGPAVQALRAQIDKETYPKKMLEILKIQDNLDIKEAMVEDLIIEDNIVKGIILENGTKIFSEIVILTTGTYLKSDILIGDQRTRQGPNGEKPSNYLSDNLKKLGFTIKRLKTGTPPRIVKSSVDFSKMKEEKGDDILRWFSFDENSNYNLEDQASCYLIYTNSNTHKVILDNLEKSSMYGGLENIEGIGARYCPSIEDKIVRFKERNRHQLFLELEGLTNNDLYLQGFSTSMPANVQEKMVHSLEGLERAKINKYAYAIEYDAINPIHLKQSLETKIIKNLFTAGQINGTSGYEEAACQGLIAGINASLKLENKEPLIIKRNEGYIGVLIDDLVTKGVNDPYRLLTSRAEYRLLLRHDNADLRLRQYGYEVGLIDKNRYKKFLDKINSIDNLKNRLQEIKLNPNKKNNDYLLKIGSTVLKEATSLYGLLKRPEIDINKIRGYIEITEDEEIIKQIELNIKYEGYIVKAEKEAKKLIDLENKKIPEDIDYEKIKNLASEAKQKLSEIRPTSIGQALRISGVNPADITILTIYLKKEYKNESK